jgi:Ca2+-binding EF-hand superfamily protein
MASLNPRESYEARQIFALVDADADGFITPSEIGLALRGLGCLLTEADLGELRVEITRTYNDRISFDDFARIYALKRQDSLSNDNVEEFFRAFDRNKDGFIDISELKSMLMNLGEPMSEAEVSQVMLDFDKSQDGRLNIEEFARMLKERELNLS